MSRTKFFTACMCGWVVVFGCVNEILDTINDFCVTSKMVSMPNNPYKSNEEVTYLAGENNGVDENCIPLEPLSHKFVNIESLVRSYKIALNQRPHGTPWPCNVCGKLVTNIKKHMKSHNPEQHKCPLCPIVLTRADNLKRHLRMKHCPVLGDNKNLSNIQTKCEFS